MKDLSLTLIKKKECYLYCKIDRGGVQKQKPTQKLRKFFDLSAASNGHCLGVQNSFMQSKVKKYLSKHYYAPYYSHHTPLQPSNHGLGMAEKSLYGPEVLCRYIKHHLKSLFDRTPLLNTHYTPILLHPVAYQQFIHSLYRDSNIGVQSLLSPLEQYEEFEQISSHHGRNIVPEANSKALCLILSDFIWYFHIDAHEALRERVKNSLAEQTLLLVSASFPEFKFLAEFKPSLIVTAPQEPFGTEHYRLVFFKHTALAYSEEIHHSVAANRSSNHSSPQPNQAQNSTVHQATLTHHSSLQNPRVQHSHTQDPRVQHSHTQDSQVQHSQTQDPRVQHSHTQDSQVQHSHTQDPRVQHSHTQDSQVQHSHAQDAILEHAQAQRGSTCNRENSLSVRFQEYFLGKSYIPPQLGLFAPQSHRLWCPLSLMLYKEGLAYYFKKIATKNVAIVHTQFKKTIHTIKRLGGPVHAQDDVKPTTKILKIKWLHALGGRLIAQINVKSRRLHAALSEATPKTMPEGELSGGLSGRLPGGLSEKLSGGLSEGLPGELSEKLSGGLSGRLPGELSEKLSGGLSEGSPGELSEKLSGGLSGRLPGELSGKLLSTPAPIKSSTPLTAAAEPTQSEGGDPIIKGLEGIVWLKTDVWRCFTRRASLLCIKTPEVTINDSTKPHLQESHPEHSMHNKYAYTFIVNIPLTAESTHIAKPFQELAALIQELQPAPTTQHTSL